MSSDSNRTVSSVSSVNSTDTVRVLGGAAPIPTTILTTIRAASARKFQYFVSQMLQPVTVQVVANR